MAKEMMIVFVYDTTRCCKEEDDPSDAVMYFHPAWVSPMQRLSLVGQLMGVNQFLTNCFSPPKLIALQGGKFVIKKFGHYILSVGTDRNIQDWILERRANTLESILKFFHCDFETISSSFNADRNKFTEKLYQMFETYLPILQYSANLFSNIPILKLPKSASNVFLEAIQVLQYSQETNGIIAGALYYNNKVVATQLSPEITKQIVITDPYRIKAPAERVTVDYQLPSGMQLLRVYVEQRKLQRMTELTNVERNYYSTNADVTTTTTNNKKTTNNILYKKSKSIPAKEPPLSGMKRDQSRIFTVPEECELDARHYNPMAILQTTATTTTTTYSSPVKKKQDTNKSDNNFPTKISYPVTPSVCSTPLKDINRILLGTALSICSAKEETTTTPSSADEARENNNQNHQEAIDDIPDVVKEALQCKRLNKLKNATPKERLVKIKDASLSRSLSDLEESIVDRYAKVNMTLKTYSIGLPRLNEQLRTNLTPDSPEMKSRKQHRFFNTIADPFYPVFRQDGSPVSQCLYEEYISRHYGELRPVDLIGLPAQPTKLPIKENGMDSSSAVVVNVDKRPVALDVRLDNKSKQEVYRRSMSLPLKPMNVLDNDDRRKSATECVTSVFDFPQKRKLEGLQLTPLMSKLSLLADERTSGFCSRETTPSEFRDFSTTLSTTNQMMIKSKLEAMDQESEDELEDDWNAKEEEQQLPATDDTLERTELFLCGHQNMVLVLLMEDGTSGNRETVQSLVKTCTSTLERLESRLQQCLEPMPSNENKELYSILCVDPEWDTVRRSGLWGVTELDIVSSLHDRFIKASNLTDIIVRTDDTVVYGNQCGKVEVFYQQAMAPNTIGGLPNPADLMGVIPLKAKRRLERDHGVVLL